MNTSCFNLQWFLELQGPLCSLTKDSLLDSVTFATTALLMLEITGEPLLKSNTTY